MPLTRRPETRRRSSLAARGWLFLTGRPLPASQAQQEQITPIEGLPALSLDALTSVAYGPEAILVVLATAGAGALHLALPITLAIVGLLALLVLSYRQVIDGYPMGGGAYAVSRANLGPAASQVAAASLVVDYTLTVAVSIAAGIGSLTSAFPALVPATVPLCILMLAIITVLNLRGLGEAARAFLLPTAIFIVGLLAIIAVGLVHPRAPHLSQPGAPTVATTGLATVGLLLVLKAFAAGCSALTGVEAIANGVPLFRPPRVRRAKQTELLLGVLLGVMLLGLALLIRRFGIVPRVNDTVLSQVIAASVGRNWAYYVVSLAITVVLGLAANTSFGGLPVLASLLARDGYVPHFFAQRGDRLVYSRGVYVLAVLSGVLLLAVRGNTNALIPLFAIGVFTGFTLAQSGMVVHWRRLRPPNWHVRATLNGIGAATTAVATVVFVFTKFTAGAWVVVVAIPLLIVGFRRVAHYYRRTGEELRIAVVPPPPDPHELLVIVPILNVSALTAQALSDAKSTGGEVLAVTVAFAEDTDRVERLEKHWAEWQPGVRLAVLHTQYHSVVRPVERFVQLCSRPGQRVMVLIPVLEPRHWRQRVLHNQLDLALSSALRARDDVIVARSVLHLE